MRKFFMLVAIVGLALLLAVPAMALDFKFGAEYRVRFYTNSNGSQGGLGNNEGIANPAAPTGTFNPLSGSPGTQRGVQVRVRPRFDVSDDNGNMTATLRLEIGDIEWGNGGGANGVANGAQGTIANGARTGNGSGGMLGVDGVNVETKWAYVDFATPWGVPLRWRAGLQPWYESKGIFVDDDVAGLRAYGKAGIASYEVGWYRASGGPCTNTVPTTSPNTGLNACSTSNLLDNNYDFYEAKLGLAVAKPFNATVYYIYGDNRATNTGAPVTGADTTKPVTAHFAGLRFDGDFGFMTYDVDAVFGKANGGPTGNFVTQNGRESTQGWGLDGGVHFPVGPVLLHVVGSYATGDKQNGGNSEALPYISPSWNGAGGLYEIVGSGGVFDQVDVTQDYPAGLWMLGAGVEYRPVKALWTRFMYGFAGFTSSRANCAYSSSKVAGACFGPSYGGKGYVMPGVAAGAVVPDANGRGGIAGKSTLGHEINIRADYDLWTNFKIQGNVGWLIPSEGDTVGEYVLQLLYSF